MSGFVKHKGETDHREERPGCPLTKILTVPSSISSSYSYFSDLYPSLHELCKHRFFLCAFPSSSCPVQDPCFWSSSLWGSRPSPLHPVAQQCMLLTGYTEAAVSAPHSSPPAVPTLCSSKVFQSILKPSDSVIAQRMPYMELLMNRRDLQGSLVQYFCNLSQGPRL